MEKKRDRSRKWLPATGNLRFLGGELLLCLQSTKEARQTRDPPNLRGQGSSWCHFKACGNFMRVARTRRATFSMANDFCCLLRDHAHSRCSFRACVEPWLSVACPRTMLLGRCLWMSVDESCAPYTPWIRTLQSV